MSEIGKQQDGRKKYDQRKSHGQFFGAGQKAFCKRRTHSYLAEPRRRAKGLRDYIEVAAGVKEDALTERCHSHPALIAGALESIPIVEPGTWCTTADLFVFRFAGMIHAIFEHEIPVEQKGEHTKRLSTQCGPSTATVVRDFNRPSFRIESSEYGRH